MLTQVDLLLTLFLGGPLVFIYSMIYVWTRRLVKNFSIIQSKANSSKTFSITEGLNAYKEIKANNLSTFYQNKFSDSSFSYAVARTSVQTLGQIPRHALETLMFSGALLTVIFLLKGGDNTSEKLPLITLFCFAGLKLIPSAQHTYYFANLARSMRASFQFVINLINELEEPSPLKPTQHKVNKESFRKNKGISFQAVNFDFGQKEAFSLKNISFNCKLGETIGIVGHSGSGKTTIVDLALGLLKPTNGKILFLEKEMYSFDPAQRAVLLGYVPQDVAIIEGDIMTNITFRVDKSELDKKSIEKVLEETELLEFISDLPDGVSTKLVKSSDLSGGQRQRIGLARALLKDPKLLILDEFTSSLDTVTETKIMKMLFKNRKERCTIIIAHRINTVKRADKIFVMKNGQIVSNGTFLELKENCIHFQELLNATSEERYE